MDSIMASLAESMTPWIILAIIAIVVLIALAALVKGRQSVGPSTDTKQYLYQRKKLFSQNELSFYKQLLKEANNLNLVVFVKVRLADLIEPKKGSGNWRASFAKIQSKHVDFVLCDRATLEPVLVVELDDPSHLKEDRKQRDAFVDKALTSSKIPIVHLWNNANLKLGDTIKKNLYAKV